MSEACDPIAVAALVVELDEAEKAFGIVEKDFLAMTVVRNTALARVNAMQERIDKAIGALKSKAPSGSRWRNVAGMGQMDLTANQIQLYMQQVQQMQAPPPQRSGVAMAPPPGASFPKGRI